MTKILTLNNGQTALATAPFIHGVVSATQPTSPADGDIWIDTDAPAIGGTGGDGSIPIGKPTTNPAAGSAKLYLAATEVAGSSITPTMTGESAPSGYAIADSNWETYAAWMLFANNSSLTSPHGWISNNTSCPHYVRYSFAESKAISGYSLMPWSNDDFPARSPTAWILQGAVDDNFTWENIDTRSILSSAWSSYAYSDFSLSSVVNYKHYRLDITANGGSAWTALCRMRLIGTPATAYTLSALLPDGSTVTL